MLVNLRFTEAARGVNKDININVIDTCPKCVGSRCEPGTKSVKCTYCNGTGMETFSRGMLLILTQKRNHMNICNSRHISTSQHRVVWKPRQKLGQEETISCLWLAIENVKIAIIPIHFFNFVQKRYQSSPVVKSKHNAWMGHVARVANVVSKHIEYQIVL